MTLVQEPAEEAPPARRGRFRGALQGLSTVLIVSGVLLLVDAGVTVVWQEPLSALYQLREQDRLGGELDSLGRVAPTQVERRALAALPDDSSRIAFAARALDRKVQDGQPIGRIRIKRIDVNKVIVEGTDTDDLRKGPGHYPRTPMAGAPGTVAIAGHRTTYGAPFRNVDRLRRGDTIVLEMPYAKITYRVDRVRIVDDSATWVVERRSFDRLVLTACHPLYSAAQRIVVFARPVRATASDRLY